jgi:hypothetical protein
LRTSLSRRSEFPGLLLGSGRPERSERVSFEILSLNVIADS